MDLNSPWLHFICGSPKQTTKNSTVHLSILSRNLSIIKCFTEFIWSFGRYKVHRVKILLESSVKIGNFGMTSIIVYGCTCTQQQIAEINNDESLCDKSYACYD